MAIKQVIVMRKDLKMRRGKEIAQGAHASMAWLTRRIRYNEKWDRDLRDDVNWYVLDEVEFTPEEMEWMTGAFTKVCVQVNSEQELRDILTKAREAGLEAHLIVDNGATEFHGVPTPTCVGIGPDDANKIDAITGGLKLY